MIQRRQLIPSPPCEGHGLHVLYRAGTSRVDRIVSECGERWHGLHVACVLLPRQVHKLEYGCKLACRFIDHPALKAPCKYMDPVCVIRGWGDGEPALEVEPHIPFRIGDQTDSYIHVKHIRILIRTLGRYKSSISSLTQVKQ